MTPRSPIHANDRSATPPADSPSALPASGRTSDLAPISQTRLGGKGASRGYWKGLSILEWRAHNKLILAALTLWLVLVWALSQASSPGWMLLFGLVYALVAGPAFGGDDVIEGCEEYSFSLPATRQERYMARLAVGGGLLLVFTALDLLALGLDLGQAIERLYIDTGLVRSSASVEPHALYGLVLLLPVAVFACGFAIASNARSRAMVFTAWFWGGLIALATLRASLKYEFWKWRTWTGSVACVSLGVLAVGSLWLGARWFANKEVVQPTKPLSIPALWWLWVVLTLISVVTGGLLLSSLSNEFFILWRK